LIKEKTNARLKELAKETAEDAFNAGQAYVKKTLNRTQDKFLENFTLAQEGDLYVITIKANVAYLDKGFSSFDMKPGLLNGPKSKPLKDGTGRYNRIPIPKNPLVHPLAGGGNWKGDVDIVTVSSNSAPSSWIHPGFKGINLYDKLVSFIQKNLTDSLNGIKTEFNNF